MRLAPLVRPAPRLVLVLALTATLCAQAPAGAPADRWPQFRGSPALTGISAATLPATLKLLWTYEAGDAIDSSAAIADGVVYVGSQTGELHAVNLADGSLKWKYKATADGIGESSPAVADGRVYIGDLAGVVHAVDAASGKAVWTFKTGSEVKSSPVVTDGKVLIGSYDSYLYALGAKDGKEIWEGADQRLRPRHPGRRQRDRLHRRLRRDVCAASGSPTAKKCSSCRPAPTPARRRSSSTATPTTGPTRTRCSGSI